MGMTITDEMAAETLAADNAPEAMAARRAALAKQLDEVDAWLAEEKVATKMRAISDIRAAMLSHGITEADLAGADAKAGKVVTRMSPGEPKASALIGTKVAPKYRDPATGKTWSGRGLQPLWLKHAIAAGAELESFRIGGAA